VHEFTGVEPGPATAIVSGITGDKPLGVIAAHQLASRLASEPLRGTVLVIPLANPYGFEGGTRHDPDLVELNRRFPGAPSGLMFDQIAHAIFKVLKEHVTAVVDLTPEPLSARPNTPTTMATRL
jgi:predicted deacylase